MTANNLNRPPVVTFSIGAMFLVASLLGLSAFLLLVELIVSGHSALSLDSSTARFSFLILAYSSGVIASLAVGLFRNRYWAWDGTVCMLVLCGIAGPAVTAMAFNDKWMGGLTGATILAIIGFILGQFFKPAARENFSFVPRVDQAIPSTGLRLVAAQHILAAGFQFAEALNPSPATILGTLPGAIPLMIYALGTGSASLYVGCGLYAMRRLAYRIGLAYTLWGGVTLLHWMLFPPGAATVTIPFRIVMGVVAWAFVGFTLWQLLGHRSEYS